MFNIGINSANGAIKLIENAGTPEEFELAMRDVRKFFKEMGIDAERLMQLESRGFFMKNEYSEKDNEEKLQQAKGRVAAFIEEIMEGKTPDAILYHVLDNFYLFLEALLEKNPNSKGGIKKEQLQEIHIKNEYDVQHFLYAYLKPLYPFARMEVTEDTGYGSVRVDIFIDEETVVEVKCTRANMTKKALTEEIAADMVQYHAHNIYFFIYDKEKLLNNPQVFKKEYEKKMKEKNVCIIIHQDKNL